MTIRNAEYKRFASVPPEEMPGSGLRGTAKSTLKFAEIAWVMLEIILALGEIISLFSP